MANKIGTICYRCGVWVAPGEGAVELVKMHQHRKWPDAKLPKWLTQHHQCAIKCKGTRQHYLYAPYEVEGVLVEFHLVDELSDGGEVQRKRKA